MAYDGLIDSASFSGHEPFPLRFAWLKKGYDYLSEDPQFFSDPDAMVELSFLSPRMTDTLAHHLVWGSSAGRTHENELHGIEFR